MKNLTAHKNHFFQRCIERAYEIEDAMKCVVKMDGDMWTIDVDHPSYPHPRDQKIIDEIKAKREIGAGTELKKILATVGIKSSPTCSCNAKAKKMNEKGIQWCKDNIDTIVDWLQEEAKKRKLPFAKFIGQKIVKLAIKRAEKNAT